MDFAADLKTVQGWASEASPYLQWIAGLANAIAGSSPKNLSKTTSVVATALSAGTAIATSSALGGIPGAIGAGFQALGSVTNLVAQKDAELNTPEMKAAAEAAKIQAIRDHAAAVVDYCERMNDMTGIRLLLS